MLTATPSAGAVIDWYTLSAGGTSVTTSNSYSPSITTSTTYYAQARIAATGCISASRTPVLATWNAVPSIVRSGGAATQSVVQNAAISAISYTASNSGTFTKTGSTFPSGLNVSNSGSSYTISGTPTATGTFGYSLTASANGCTSAAAAGTITVVPYGFTTSTGGPNTAYTTKTWITGAGSSAQTWSDRRVKAVCTKVDKFTTSNNTTTEYAVKDGRYYYSWSCAYNNRTTLCPPSSGWRMPSRTETAHMQPNLGHYNALVGNVLLAAWGSGGYYNGSSFAETTGDKIWLIPEWNADTAEWLSWSQDWWTLSAEYKRWGVQVRCVK
jgi:hypothetical protein